MTDNELDRILESLDSVEHRWDEAKQEAKRQIKLLFIQERMDELSKLRPIVHNMGLISYRPRMITVESVVERFKELNAQLPREAQS